MEANALRIIMKANTLRIMKDASTLRIITKANTFRIITQSNTLSIMKDASTMAYTYLNRNLVTTLNFRCSVWRSISAHCKISEGEGREETDVSLSAEK
jgi:hypothetical protein